MFSIIIPIYNTDSDMLEYNFNKLISIKKRDVEFVLVNDGSEDYVETICKKYMELDKRFIYFKIKNSGVSNARNIGIENCSGEFLLFLDSDDFLDNDVFDSLSKEIEYDLYMFDYNLKYESQRDKIFETNIPYGIYDINQIKEFKSKVVCSSSFNTVHSKIYKRKIILSNNISFPENIKVGEDLIFNLKYLSQCKNAKYEKYILTNYRIYESSSVRKFPLDRFNDFISEINARFDFMQKEDLISVKNALYDYCQNLLFSNVLNSINYGNELHDIYDILKNEDINNIIIYKKSKLVNKLKMKLLFNKKILLKICKFKKKKGRI